MKAAIFIAVPGLGQFAPFWKRFEKWVEASPQRKEILEDVKKLGEFAEKGWQIRASNAALIEKNSSGELEMAKGRIQAITKLIRNFAARKAEARIEAEQARDWLREIAFNSSYKRGSGPILNMFKDVEPLYGSKLDDLIYTFEYQLWRQLVSHGAGIKVLAGSDGFIRSIEPSGINKSACSYLFGRFQSTKFTTVKVLPSTFFFTPVFRRFGLVPIRNYEDLVRYWSPDVSIEQHVWPAFAGPRLSQHFIDAAGSEYRRHDGLGLKRVQAARRR
jgi:hypothetical protein